MTYLQMSDIKVIDHIFSEYHENWKYGPYRARAGRAFVHICAKSQMALSSAKTYTYKF